MIPPVAAAAAVAVAGVAGDIELVSMLALDQKRPAGQEYSQLVEEAVAVGSIR